jgi:hypothetical protein
MQWNSCSEASDSSSITLWITNNHLNYCRSPRIETSDILLICLLLHHFFTQPEEEEEDEEDDSGEF